MTSFFTLYHLKDCQIWSFTIPELAIYFVNKNYKYDIDYTLVNDLNEGSLIIESVFVLRKGKLTTKDFNDYKEPLKRRRIVKPQYVVTYTQATNTLTIYSSVEEFRNVFKIPKDKLYEVSLHQCKSLIGGLPFAIGILGEPVEDIMLRLGRGYQISFEDIHIEEYGVEGY